MSQKQLFYLWAFLIPCIFSGCYGDTLNFNRGSIIQPYSISFDQSLLDLKKGDTCTLNVIYYPNNILDKTLSWQSGDTTIVKVDSVGRVTAIDLGETHVTAQSPFDQVISCQVLVRGEVSGEFENTPSGGNGGSTGDIDW